MHLVSHCVLINFVITQWPNMFNKLRNAHQKINYILHATGDASIARRVMHLLFLSYFLMTANIINMYLQEKAFEIIFFDPTLLEPYRH